jgi:hypothetical protein
MPVVEIAYNPNDFYYVSSHLYDDINARCLTYLGKNKQEWETKCCTNKLDKKDNCNTWNLVNCYEFELCKNKEYADLANSLDNNNSGANERHLNLKNHYQNELIKTINISASILLITYLSVYFFKS